MLTILGAREEGSNIIRTGMEPLERIEAEMGTDACKGLASEATSTITQASSVGAPLRAHKHKLRTNKCTLSHLLSSATRYSSSVVASVMAAAAACCASAAETEAPAGDAMLLVCVEVYERVLQAPSCMCGLQVVLCSFFNSCLGLYGWAQTVQAGVKHVCHAPTRCMAHGLCQWLPAHEICLQR